MATSSSDNPEEIEIDRLLLELGIVLPAVENTANHAPPVGISSALQSIGENNNTEPLQDETQDEDNTVSFWLPHPRERFLSWPPETES